MNKELIREITCIGGCGSGIGFFVILIIVGGLTLLGVMLYLILKKGEKNEF